MAADRHTEADRRALSALHEFAARTRTVARRSGLDAAAARAVLAFRSAGVDVLLLKGVVLARVLYREDEARGYFDVDMLVAPAQLTAAGEVLTALGYRNVSADWGIDDVADIQHAEVWAQYDPEFGNLTIDLHWRLDGCRAPAQLAWDVLKREREQLELAGATVSVLDRPALALHLALHAAQHGPDDAKAIGDMNRGLERWSDEIWSHAALLAEALQGSPAFAAGLRLVPAGGVLADHLNLPAADAVLWEIEHHDARPRGTFHWQALHSAGGWRARADIVRRSLFPRRQWIVWEHPWASASRARLAAAYCLHLARAPVWAARAWRFGRGRPGA